LLKLIVYFQNTGNLLVSATHQSRFLEFGNSESIYITFPIFLDAAYLNYSKLFPKNNAEVSEVAKLLDVSPAQCEKSLSI